MVEDGKVVVYAGMTKALADALHDWVFGQGAYHDAHEGCAVCSGLDWLPDKDGFMVWQPDAYWPNSSYSR